MNNAGAAWGAPFEGFPEAGWDKVLELNLKSPFFLTQALHGALRAAASAARPAKVINIASIDGMRLNTWETYSYQASKAGLIALTKSLGKELAGYDIAVNAVTPAAAKTAIFDQLTQEHIDFMLSKIPRNRFVTVEEVAALVAWLASAENSFTTGAVFDISGGRATY